MQRDGFVLTTKGYETQRDPSVSTVYRNVLRKPRLVSGNESTPF